MQQTQMIQTKINLPKKRDVEIQLPEFDIKAFVILEVMGHGEFGVVYGKIRKPY